MDSGLRGAETSPGCVYSYAGNDDVREMGMLRWFYRHFQGRLW